MENIVRALFIWDKERSDVSRNISISSCLIVHNPQGSVFCIYTVDDTSYARLDCSIRTLYADLLENGAFGPHEGEWGMSQIVPEKLLDILQDNG